MDGMRQKNLIKYLLQKKNQINVNVKIIHIFFVSFVLKVSALIWNKRLTT